MAPSDPAARIVARRQVYSDVADGDRPDRTNLLHLQFCM
jgi:hypothetical protein